MKALTLTQPYATLIAKGAKEIETRSWSTYYRGQLAIHAAKGLGSVGGKAGLWDLCQGEPFAGALRDWGLPSALPLGAIVAVCKLKDCKIIGVPLSGIPEILHEDNMSFIPILGQERAFGNYAPGRYAWLLAEIRPLPEPIPAKGALGLWDLDTQTEMAVTRQLMRGVARP